jgi:threonine synthase
VSDAEILEAQRALAVREGLFCQPESAVTWAGLARLAREDGMEGTGSAVLVLTGSGLKAAQSLELQPVRPEDVELPSLEKALRDGAAGHA